MATTHKHTGINIHALRKELKPSSTLPTRKVKTIARLSIEAGADPGMLTVKNWFRRLRDKSFTGYVTANYSGDGSVKFDATYMEPREEAIRRLAAERIVAEDAQIKRIAKALKANNG